SLTVSRRSILRSSFIRAILGPNLKVTELGRKLESQGSKPIRYHLRVGSTTYVRLPENSRGVLMIHDVDFLLTRLRTADPVVTSRFRGHPFRISSLISQEIPSDTRDISLGLVPVGSYAAELGWRKA